MPFTENKKISALTYNLHALYLLKMSDASVVCFIRTGVVSFHRMVLLVESMDSGAVRIVSFYKSYLQPNAKNIPKKW